MASRCSKRNTTSAIFWIFCLRGGKKGTRKNNDEKWVTIQFWWDDGMREWHCTTPYWFWEGACVKATWNDVRGDTLVECLLAAVLTLAKRGFYRDYLSKTYVVENWRYKPEEK